MHASASAGLDVGRGVDVHAHFFSSSLPEPANSATPWLEVNQTNGRIMLDGKVFRTVAPPLWSLAARLEAMDAAGVAHQVISPVPVMLTYADDPDVTSAFARAVNDSIAAEVQAANGRLSGLGMVALQDPELAVSELTRIAEELQLSGVEIGTQIVGTDLDDPSLCEFFAAAEALGLAIFVHPLDGGGRAIRRTGQLYDFGLGMLTDTAIAATSLVFGGVLAAFPELRVCLAHGCGTFPWAYPRLRLSGVRMLGGDADLLDALTQRLWADTLVFDPDHLRLLVQRFGASHVVVGTDFPFIAGQLEGARDLLDAAVASGACSAAEAGNMWRDNAFAFLGRLSAD